MKAADFNLPEFDIPDLPVKKLTRPDYHAWITANRRRLRSKGKLEEILNAPERVPVDVPFSLPRE